MRIIHIVSFLIVGAVLVGCTAASNSWNDRFVNATPPSSELKQTLLKIARDIVFDPGSIRDAEISHVFGDGGAALYGNKKEKAVCVKFNSKNRMGGYVGRTTYVILLNANEKPSNYIAHSPICNNSALKWEVFKEANGLASL